jgi:hypothetical protein
MQSSAEAAFERGFLTCARTELIPPSGSFGRSLPFQLAQIAEAAHRQPAGILDALFGQPANVPRELAPHSWVQIMSGHAAIDLHCPNERLCDFDLKHSKQRAAPVIVPKCCRAATDRE